MNILLILTGTPIVTMSVAFSFRIYNYNFKTALLLSGFRSNCTRKLSSSSSLYNLKWSLSEEPCRSYISKLQANVISIGDLANQNSDQFRKLRQIATLAQKFYSLADEHSQLLDLAKDDDSELQQLAKEDIQNVLEQQEEIESKIFEFLIPPMPAQNNDVFLEVYAGVGGLEAMLFTAELFDLYQGYAYFRGWQFEIVDYETSEIGGVRRATASIHGADAVYLCLSRESGVHRVQRVPRTEKAGRVHTSTACVAILPQPSEIDVVVNPKDLKVDTFKASGKGGQHVNTTDSAVRLTHIPTGVVSECQQERSQHRNKEMALQLLRSKLFESQVESQLSSQRTARKLQIGTRSRSEKIRTYNYPQDRITDHRLSSNVYGIDVFMKGTGSFHHLHEDLELQSRNDVLSNLFQHFERTGDIGFD